MCFQQRSADRFHSLRVVLSFLSPPSQEVTNDGVQLVGICVLRKKSETEALLQEISRRRAGEQVPDQAVAWYKRKVAKTRSKFRARCFIELLREVLIGRGGAGITRKGPIGRECGQPDQCWPALC